MPAAYHEPSSDGSGGATSAQRIALAMARAQSALANVGAGTLGTFTAVNAGNVSPGAAATVIASVTGVVVPAGAKAIISASMQLDVKTPETGGADNLATLETRFNTGGPPTIVDSAQELLFVGASLTLDQNILSYVSETAPLAGGTYTFDFAVLSTVAGSDNVAPGKGRIVVQLVGS